MSKIIISSDSTTDLSAELREKYDVKIIPLGITLGTELYRDGIDITPDFIYEHHEKTGELPKTNAANVGEFIDYFSGIKGEEDTLIHFSLSSTMSSTYSNACIAAAEVGNVYIIDSKNLSTGGGLLVIAAAEMVNDGKSAEEIVEAINKMADCVDASFVIDSLEYLYKGGRCSAVSMLGANLLKLKPCIEVKNGSMGVGKKYRGVYGRVLTEYVAERLVNVEDIDTTRAFVTHAGCDQEIVDAVYEQVKASGIFDEVLLTRAGCTISSHCGANTLGVLFVRKSPIA